MQKRSLLSINSSEPIKGLIYREDSGELLNRLIRSSAESVNYAAPVAFDPLTIDGRLVEICLFFLLLTIGVSESSK